MDWYWVNTCTKRKTLRYSDFNFGNTVRTDEAAIKEQREWLGTVKEQLNKLIAEECDAIVTGLYEYNVCYRQYFPHRTHFIPFPIRIPATYSTTQCKRSKVSIFIGLSRERSKYKGTDIMLEAAKNLHDKYAYRMDLNVVEGVPFAQYQQMMDESDAILDQLYSYTPSMNSLLAMSKGIICIGGGEPENYEILNEEDLRPIINVQPTYESVYHELEQLIIHPDRIPELKLQSRKYVERHHDFLKVAHQYELLYLSLL